MKIEGTKLIKIEEGDIPADGHFTIPPQITAIGDAAFRGWTELTAVTFNERLTYIGSWAFRDCTGLTTVAFNKQLTTIGDSAFENCTKLTHVAFNEQLTEIGEWAFSGCTQLTAVIFNKKLTQIKGWAFKNCAKLAVAIFNENLTRIGCYAFEDCSELTAVTFNTQLTQIGAWAFFCCIKIKDIAIATKNQEAHNKIKKLLPPTLRWRCLELSVYEQLLAIRTEALRGILAEPLTHPVRRYANNLSSFERFPQYADFWQILNQLDPEGNRFYNKAKWLMDCLPWPDKKDKEGFAKYSNQCQEIVNHSLNRAKKGFFANSENTEKSQKSADLNPSNMMELFCEKINIGP